MRVVAIVLLALSLTTGAGTASPRAAYECTGESDPEFSAVISIIEGDRSGYINASPDDKPYELHVIGSYEGSGTLVIKPSEKPVILFLASYSSSRWQVELSDGAKVERVLIQGYEGSNLVSGLPKDVPVEMIGNGSGAYLWQDVRGDTEYMTDEFKRFIADIRCKTGQIEHSFQGSYNLGDTFMVPPMMPPLSSAELIRNAGDPRSAFIQDAAVTLKEYAFSVSSMPAEFQGGGEVLLAAMAAKTLPIYFPDGDPGSDSSAPAVLADLWFPSASTTVQIDPSVRACEGRENAAFIGTPGAETLSCGWGKQWYALGSGGDVVDDSWGDDVFIVGAGEQIFDMGWGNDIAVFQPGWGTAVINKTCHDSTMAPADKERLSWHFDHTNFLVFAQGLAPSDFVWVDDRTLVYKPTGDRVLISDNCFAMAFIEPGEPPEPFKPTNRVQ